MAIIILGGEGMLGKAVTTACEARAEFIGPVVPISHADFDVTDPPSFLALERDVFINCAGVLPGGDPVKMAEVNAVAPHRLAAWAQEIGFKLIHISTDCVYSGSWMAPLQRTSRDVPNPDTLYGMTKRAGEIQGENIWTVRTSFVGPTHGLWRWLDEHEEGAVVEGYTRAWWSGSTVWAVASKIVDMIVLPPPKQHLVHLATRTPIAKHDVLLALQKTIGRSDLRIVPVPKALDRSLLPDVELLPFADALAAVSG